MSTTPDLSELYVDEEYGSDQEQAFHAHVENRLKELHTSLPGIIHSYNPATNTASVQPAIQRVFNKTGAANLPLIMDVPVVFPGGGNFSITFPVTAGDECVLVFLERSMNYWYKSGGTQQPSNFRMHDFSDAVCFVGLRNQSRNLANVATDGIEIRNSDQSIFIKITPAGIQIQGNVTIVGTLSQTGDVTIEGDVAQTGNSTVNGNTNANGELTVAGAAVMQTTLEVDGEATLGEVVVGGHINPTGTLNVGALAATSIASSSTISSAADITSGGDVKSFSGISLVNHKHTGVTTGAGTSGPSV